MTNECFMTIRFKDEVVRRHFLNDITEKVIPDQDNIECDENPIYEDVVFSLFLTNLISIPVCQTTTGTFLLL